MGFGIITLFVWVYTKFWKKRGLKTKLMIATTFLFIASTITTSESVVAGIAQCLLGVTTTYMIVIKSMLFDYLDLVGRKMTVKERASRRKTLKDV